ncbi:MAG: hypothetical protein HOO88_07775 [Kiritimatiellaceae bacterium]|nr:hypothetical protein [Kiritimatiellaceae bacterium]
MGNKLKIAGVSAVLMCGLNGMAADPARPAEFVIGQTVVRTNTVGFGAEISHPQTINNWTDNPGMEPLVAREYWEISGGGTNAIGSYADCNTRKSDSLCSGFYDGAHYRLYRENYTLGRIEKIAEGTVPAGGFLADGYMTVGSAGESIKTYAPNTDVADNYLIQNGETWYYAVKAHDINGNWSDFSAAVAGVTPQAGITNGPRIATQTVADPKVGTVYAESKPFETLSALGGTLPLSWTLVSGVLPDGMSLSSAGKIFGTCSTTNPVSFVVRVTDGESRTHERTFRMFWPDPAGDGAAPAAPTNVVTEARDGFVYIRWDTPAESDITDYQIYRSRVPVTSQTERIYLDASGAVVPVSGDLLFVEKEWQDAPAPELSSLRIVQYQGTTKWSPYGNKVSMVFTNHPGTLPAQFTNEYPGAGCLKVTTSTNELFGIWQYKTASTNGGSWSTAQFTPGQTYRMECWVYGEGLTNASLRFSYGSYTDQAVTGIVNGAWTKLSVNFTATNWVTKAGSVFGPYFRFQGPGSVYLDNVVVYNVNDPAGPCHYSQSVLDLWKDYVGQAAATNKGVLRVRYNTESFDHIMNPAVMSERGWDNTKGASKGDALHIHDALAIALATGTNAVTRSVPWIIASLEWSEADYVRLAEYLAGPAGTPYGDLRIAQRGGVTTPWIDEFRKIIIEMGNEPWNTGYFFGFRGGFTGESGRTYGRFCNYIWDYVWTNSPYMTDKLKPTIGTWTTSLETDGFSANARRECPRAKNMAMTMYLGGWEKGQDGQIGGTTWSDDGVQQWPIFVDRSGIGVISNAVAFQTLMAAEGLPFEWMVYEAGPSYLMNGLNNVTLTAEEQETSRRYGRTLAAGIGTLDYFLYGAYRNLHETSFFSFTQDAGLWGSHTYIWNGYRPHPAFLGLTLINNYVKSPSSMLLTAPLNVPSFDLSYLQDGVTQTKPGMSLASVYAFRDGNRYAVLLLNKKVDGVHSGYDFGDGTTPATVHLPFSNPSSITLYKISGDPRLTNVDQDNFQIVTQSVSTAAFSQDFTVNMNTGGTTNGLPVGGIFLYVFEGGTADTLPANPQVTVTRASTQNDPQDGSVANEVRFSVIFDRPVTGFNSTNDVIIGGTASPQTVGISEIASSLGTLYEVVVSGMLAPGTVTLSVPAGAAQAQDTGNGNEGSASCSAAISFYRGLTLLGWEFINLPNSTNQNPNATVRHSFMLLSSLTNGPGCKTSANNYYNGDGYAIGNVTSTNLDLGDYLTWTVTPTNGYAMKLISIRLGAFGYIVSNAYNAQLRWSTNGFASYNTVSLAPTNQLVGAGYHEGTGTELTGDLKGFTELQNISRAVEFRYYIWNASVAAGIGRLGANADTVDLEIVGFVAPEGQLPVDLDNDGLPDWFENQYYGGFTNANPSAITSNGFNTVYEAYLVGINPTDPDALFKLSGRRNELGWNAVSGRVYTIYWTSNLLSGFQLLGSNLTASGIFNDIVHSNWPAGFYKIDVHLAP